MLRGSVARKSSGSASSVTFFVLFGAIFPLLLVREVSGPPPDLANVAAQVVVLEYASLRLAQLFATGQPKWPEIAFWSFGYTWLGLAPLLQLLANRNPYRQPVPEDAWATQLIVVLAGFLAYDAGLAVAGKRSRVDSRDTLASASVRMISRSRVRVLGILAVVATPLFVTALGGLFALFSSRQARTLALEQAGLYTASSKASGALLTAAASVIPFLALYGWYHSSRGRYGLGGIAASVGGVLLVVVNVLLNNPISSSRFWFLTMGLALIFSTARFQSAFSVRLIVAGFLFASSMVFPYLDAFRYTEASIEARSPTEFFTDKTDYDALLQVGNAIRYVDEYGHTSGQQISGAMLFWVPRSLWESKPTDTGPVLARYINYPNENLSAPLWAEGYIDFGLPGVVVIFFLLGLATRKLTSRYLLDLERYRAGGMSLVMFALPILAVYQVLILRGSLLQAMSRLAFIVLICWLLASRLKGKSLPAVEGLQQASDLTPKR